MRANTKIVLVITLVLGILLAPASAMAQGLLPGCYLPNKGCTMAHCPMKGSPVAMACCKTQEAKDTTPVGSAPVPSKLLSRDLLDPCLKATAFIGELTNKFLGSIARAFQDTGPNPPESLYEKNCDLRI